jgi:DNA-binding MarR family transcriptional regulator
MDRAMATVFRSFEMELAVYNVTPEQAAIFHVVYWADGGITINEIAEQIVRKYNSVTALINRMAKAGLVSKKMSSKDKKYIVSLTKKGLQTYKTLTSNAIEMAFSGFSEKEKQNLSIYIEKLMKAGRKMLGLDFKPPFLPA